MNSWEKDAEAANNNKRQKTQNMKHNKNQHKQGSNGEHVPDPKQVERRAYELYLKRGSGPGHDSEDWLRAECELKEQGRGALVTIAV